MPSWNDVLSEIQKEAASDPFKRVRQKYLAKLSTLNEGRNVIAYYSGWLQKHGIAEVSLSNEDKNAFMSMVHRMDRSKGLDLIIHTPGGDLCACESIVDYLRFMFQDNIRAIVPQLAMSAGTMICCSCKEIIMGKESSLGPIDPQIGGVSVHGILEEFEKAAEDINKNPSRMGVWQPIIARYNPTLLGECEKAKIYSLELCEKWLNQNMCKDDPSKAKKISDDLSDHSESKTHSRQFNIQRCKDMGLVISNLEDNQERQDTVLTIHHAYMHTFSRTLALKIIENHLGVDMTFAQNQ